MSPLLRRSRSQRAPEPGGVSSRAARGRTPDEPDYAAVLRFFNEAKNTATPLEYGELVLSRVDQYTEQFFDGLDTIISYSRFRGLTDQAERLELFKEYLRWAKKQAAEHSGPALRDDLAWGDAVGKIRELAAGQEDREATDQQFARLRELAGRTSGRQQVQRLSELATLLPERSMRSELAADLDDCIRVQQQAVEAKAPDPIERAAMLACLGSALQSRFSRRTGQGEDAIDDLTAAIDAVRQAVQLTPSSDPLYANRLGGLATLLLHRFARLGASADCDEAIKFLEDALAGKNASAAEAQMRAILKSARQLRTPQLALRTRLERFQKEGDSQLITADEAGDELLAALAQATASPDDRPELQLLIDTVNFLIFRTISVPRDQAVAEMTIRGPVAAFLTEVEAAGRAERKRLLRRSPEVARTALTGLRELWGR